jgi:hypothetical protein
MNIKLNYHTSRLYAQIQFQNNFTKIMQIRYYPIKPVFTAQQVITSIFQFNIT